MEVVIILPKWSSLNIGVAPDILVAVTRIEEEHNAIHATRCSMRVFITRHRSNSTCIHKTPDMGVGDAFVESDDGQVGCHQITNGPYSQKQNAYKSVYVALYFSIRFTYVKVFVSLDIQDSGVINIAASLSCHPSNTFTFYMPSWNKTNKSFLSHSSFASIEVALLQEWTAYDRCKQYLCHSSTMNYLRTSWSLT